MYDEREPRENIGVHATLSALLRGQADQGSSQAGPHKDVWGERRTMRGEKTSQVSSLAAP